MIFVFLPNFTLVNVVARHGSTYQITSRCNSSMKYIS